MPAWASARVLQRATTMRESWGNISTDNRIYQGQIVATVKYSKVEKEGFWSNFRHLGIARQLRLPRLSSLCKSPPIRTMYFGWKGLVAHVLLCKSIGSYQGPSPKVGWYESFETRHEYEMSKWHRRQSRSKDEPDPLVKSSRLLTNWWRFFTTAP